MLNKLYLGTILFICLFINFAFYSRFLSLLFIESLYLSYIKSISIFTFPTFIPFLTSILCLCFCYPKFYLNYFCSYTCMFCNIKLVYLLTFIYWLFTHFSMDDAYYYLPPKGMLRSRLAFFIIYFCMYFNVIFDLFYILFASHIVKIYFNLLANISL